MLKQKTKDIEVSGKKYRLNRLDARTGSYVAVKIAMLVVPIFGKDKKVDPSAIAGVLPSLSQNDFNELQNLLLKTINRITMNGDIELLEPVIRANGSFVDDDLNYDTAALITLTANAITFNVGDFFAEGALDQIKKSS